MTHQPGTPAWIDLGTTDFAASKAFYEQLFGWRFEDSGEEYGHYHMLFSGDDLVGGAMNVAGMTCPDGDPLPSEWGVFLATDDVDATVATAEQHGGQLVFPVADVGEAGRFAVLLDATRASVSAWQAGDTDGYVFSGRPGTPCWFELMSQDFDAAVEFYKNVFGLDAVPMWDPSQGEPENRYLTHGEGDAAAYGICDVKGFIPPERGSYWRVYFRIEDCDAGVQRVQALGGTLLDGPEDSPFGRIATVADPAGAEIQIIDPTKAAPFEA